MLYFQEARFPGLAAVPCRVQEDIQTNDPEVIHIATGAMLSSLGEGYFHKFCEKVESTFFLRKDEAAEFYHGMVSSASRLPLYQR